MYARAFFEVPFSFVSKPGLDAHTRWYASDSIKFITQSSIISEKNQNRTDPYSIACSRSVLPVMDMCAVDRHAATRCFICLYFFVHHSSMLNLFPIGTPSARMLSPSATHASSLMMPRGAR